MMLILLGHFVRFGHFVPLDILSHQAFCPFRHFVSLGIMSFGHFIPLGILSYLDKMSFGHFVHGHFVICGHFVTLGISSYNQNSLALHSATNPSLHAIFKSLVGTTEALITVLWKVFYQSKNTQLSQRVNSYEKSNLHFKHFKV